MANQEELTDKDPFDEEKTPIEEVELISDPMVKKVTFLIYKLANQRNEDFVEIQKKCKKLFAYTNLAKVTMEDGHKIIEKLIEVTGGEEKESQLPRKTGDGFKNKNTKTLAKPSKEKTAIINTEEMKELETEIGKLAVKLQICVRKSRHIVEEEIGKENITEGTRATLVKSFAATLFIESSRRGVGR